MFFAKKSGLPVFLGVAMMVFVIAVGLSRFFSLILRRG